MATSAQLLQQAKRHQAQGHLREAMALFRNVLRQEPAQADALHGAGVVAHQQGDTRPRKWEVVAFPG